MGKKFSNSTTERDGDDKNQWHDAKSMRSIIVQARAREKYIYDKERNKKEKLIIPKTIMRCALAYG